MKRRRPLAGDDQGSVSSMASQREFTDFYTEWRDSIRRALALTIGDITIADDATEEAMTRALASWAKIRDYDRPEGWVYRVGLNWSRGLFRKRRYEILTHLDPDSAPAETPVPDVDVIDAVGRLSRQLRPIVIARYYLDWSTADVAAAFDIPEGTVKSRLSRALTRLAQDLGDTP